MTVEKDMAADDAGDPAETRRRPPFALVFAGEAGPFLSRLNADQMARLSRDYASGQTAGKVYVFTGKDPGFQVRLLPLEGVMGASSSHPRVRRTGEDLPLCEICDQPVPEGPEQVFCSDDCTFFHRLCWDSAGNKGPAHVQYSPPESRKQVAAPIQRCSDCQHWNAYVEVDALTSYGACDMALDPQHVAEVGKQHAVMMVPERGPLRTRHDHHCGAFVLASETLRRARQQVAQEAQTAAVLGNRGPTSPAVHCETPADFARAFGATHAPLDHAAITAVVEAIACARADGRNLNTSTGEPYPDPEGLPKETIDNGLQWNRKRYALVKQAVEGLAEAIVRRAAGLTT